MSEKLSLLIPKNWTIAKLEDLVSKFIGGGTPSKANPAYYQGDIPWMTVKDMTSSRPQKITDYITLEAITDSATNLIPPDTIIIATRMSLGKIVRLPFEVAINQDLKALILPQNIEKDFVEYWYISETSNIQSLGTGTTVKGIRLEVLQQLKVPLPPLNEQRRIVAKIEALKARSQRVKDALEDIPQLLDQFRQSVLAAAFRGDLTADWREQNPDVEPASVLIERTASQMIRGKETGRAATVNVIPGRAALGVGDILEPVPKNWIRVPLLKIARLESGHTPSRKHPEYWGGEIPWIGIADAREHHGKYINNTSQYINEKGLANSAARLLPENTVCLSRTASVGYAVIMGKQMATSQDFVNWSCSNALLPKFLLYAFLAEGDHLLKFGKGTTHTTIYFPEVKAFHITLPPIKEQKEIVQRIELFLKYISNIENQYQMAQGQVQKLDQSVLAKAFRGELVPQDPNDEPASVLLEQIRAQRDKLETKTAKKSTAKTSTRRTKNTQLQEQEPIQLELGLE